MGGRHAHLMVALRQSVLTHLISRSRDCVWDWMDDGDLDPITCCLSRSLGMYDWS